MTAPTPSQYSSSNGQTAQVESAPNDISVLSSDSASDMLKTAALSYRINQVIQQNESQNIITSVDITDMQSGRTLVSHNPATAQYAASINKLPIALLLLQDLRAGRVHLSDKITWTSADVISGFGVYDQPGAPTTATVQQLIQDMLNASGNTAVRVLVDRTSLGGATAVNARLAQYPQLVQTRLQVVDSSHFFLGNTTAAESLWTMQQVQKTKDQYEQLMQHAMATNIFTTYGVRSQLAGNNYISLANKVGILDDPAGTGNNRHDVGIVYNAQTQRSYAYSLVTTNFSADSSLDAPAESSLQQMGLDILRYAGDKPQTGVTATPFAQSQTPQTKLKPQKKVLY